MFLVMNSLTSVHCFQSSLEEDACDRGYTGSFSSWCSVPYRSSPGNELVLVGYHDVLISRAEHT